MEHFNRLTRAIHSSLVSLHKALKGLVVMNAELESLSNALLMGKVPEYWQEWMDQGKSSVFWISGFYFAQVGAWVFISIAILPL